MEVSALKHAGAAPHGRSPLLRLQSDERLIALIRRGNHHAFESLVSRYQSRLLAFCRHMLGSREDAEDVLQEVFAAAFNAIIADERPINVRPWLYRIARNRSLNHLRRAQPVGMDSMDVHFAEGGTSTADKVHKREEFRLLIADVQDLPETQRTALLLREIDALSYEQIAEAMETTVPSVKSLLVRARVSLAEAAEARLLTCEQVRAELGEVAEGLARTTAPVRRHLRTCERCAAFRKQLRQTNKALAALFPVGPLLLLKKLFFAQLGSTAAAGGTTAASTAGATAGASALQAGLGALATKTAAGLTAAAIVTAGAVEVKHVTIDKPIRHSTVQVAQAPPAPTSAPSSAPEQRPQPISSAPQPDVTGQATPVTLNDVPTGTGGALAKRVKSKDADKDATAADSDAAAATGPTGPVDVAAVLPTTGDPSKPAVDATGRVQRESDTTQLPSRPTPATTGGAIAPEEPTDTTAIGPQTTTPPVSTPTATPTPPAVTPTPTPTSTPSASPTPAADAPAPPEATPTPGDDDPTGQAPADESPTPAPDTVTATPAG